MFDNFKNCITTNLISLFGYLIFIGTNIFFEWFYPNYVEYEKTHKNMAYLSDTLFYNYPLIVCCVYILLFILFICYYIERYLQDIGKIKTLKILENFNKPKTIIFWLGYFLIFTPIYYFIIAVIWLFIVLAIHL